METTAVLVLLSTEECGVKFVPMGGASSVMGEWCVFLRSFWL
jgi:hypothetical protein